MRKTGRELRSGSVMRGGGLWKGGIRTAQDEDSRLLSISFALHIKPFHKILANKTKFYSNADTQRYLMCNS